MRQIDNISIPVVDHCNLNCAGCVMFSPLSDPYFIDVNKLRDDCKQIASMFDWVNEIRLFGGEPLLHPQIEEIVRICRQSFSFPYTTVKILTNGIKLPSIPQSFWDCIHDNLCELRVTIYRPYTDLIADISRLAIKNEIPLQICAGNTFYPMFNTKGNSDPEIAKKQCRSLCSKHYPAPVLRNGKIYPCFMPVVVNKFNSHFKTNIDKGYGLDIYSNSTSDIIEFIEKGIPNQCRFCVEPGCRGVKWGLSKKELTEWDMTSTTNKWLIQEIRNRKNKRLKTKG